MVTLRSVLIGLASVLLIACLAPYNNLIVANTFLIGGTLPVIIVLFLLLVLLLNRILRLRLSRAESVAILAMMLAGCAAPSIGFVQYVAGVLPGLKQLSDTSPQVRETLENIGLPAWAFPASFSAALDDPGSVAVRSLITRVPDGERIPYGSWVMPVLSWSLLGVLVFTAVMMLSVLVRKQWVENERLPFPVATVMGALLAGDDGSGTPRPLRSQWFWWAAVSVVVVRSLAVLQQYYPVVPAIPLSFDLASLFANPPLNAASDMMYRTGFYFAVIGMTFFLQTRIAFSIWFLYIASQVVQITAGSMGGEVTGPMRQDQTLGALISFVLLVMWVGRAHWGMIVRHMLVRRAEGEDRGEVLSYRVAGWVLVTSTLGIIGWLIAAGVGVGAAIYITMFLLIIAMTIARVAAETGLYYVQIPYPMHRPMTGLLSVLGTQPTSTRSFFWTATLGAIFTHDTREAAGTYFTHALRLHQPDPKAHPRQGRRLVACMLLAVAISIPVAFASHLYLDFKYAATLADPSVAPVNAYGVDYIPRNLIVDPTTGYASARSNDGHETAVHVGIGATLSAIFGICRLRINWFPLHPLGVLLVYTFPVARMWFSIFLGWLLKVIIIRLGGARLLRQTTPIFIGLVVGECMAAGMWLTINLIAASTGQSYSPVYFTP